MYRDFSMSAGNLFILGFRRYLDGGSTCLGVGGQFRMTDGKYKYFYKDLSDDVFHRYEGE